MFYRDCVTILQSLEQVILVASLNCGCSKKKKIKKRIPRGNFDLK